MLRQNPLYRVKFQIKTEGAMKELQKLVDGGVWVWPTITRILGDRWYWQVDLATNIPNGPRILSDSENLEVAIHEAVVQATELPAQPAHPEAAANDPDPAGEEALEAADR